MGEPPNEISKADYEALHAFRHALRRFLHFSEEGARAAGLTPQQHQLLLAVKGQPGRDWATIQALAEALQIRDHAAVGMVDRCERDGPGRRPTHPPAPRQVGGSLTGERGTILKGPSGP